MAHRTLLLLVLAVVIVALAAMAGISTFAEGAAKNRQEMVFARSVQLAAYSQEWFATPEVFGGGNGSYSEIDIWEATGQNGTGEWLEEGSARYSVEPLLRPGHAVLTAEDTELEMRVVMVFDGNSIVSTDYLDPGVIFIDPEKPIEP